MIRQGLVLAALAWALAPPVVAGSVETESAYVRQTLEGLSVYRQKTPVSSTWDADWWVPSNASSLAVGLEDTNLQVTRRPLDDVGTRIGTANGLDLWRLDVAAGNTTWRSMSMVYTVAGHHYVHRTSAPESLVLYLAVLPGALPQAQDGVGFIVHRVHPTQPVFATLPTSLDANQTLSVWLREPSIESDGSMGALSAGLLAGSAGGLALSRSRGPRASRGGND